MNISKNTLIAYILFIFSPILTLPVLVAQLHRYIDKGVLLLISLFYGYLSFKYVPSFSNDKVRYMERYDTFANYNISELINYFIIVKRPDFIFDSINFAFAKLNVDVHFFFLLITFFSVFSLLYFIKCQVAGLVQEKFYFGLFTIALVIFSLSLPSLLSGIRFLFAGSVFVWGVYFFLAERKRPLLSSCIFAIAISIHFSFFLLVAAAYLSRFRLNQVFATSILCISVVFLFGSTFAKEIFEGVLNIISLPDSYLSKTSLYLGEEFEVTFNALILHYLRHLWLFYLLFFLFFNYEKERYYVFMVYLVFIVCLLSFIDTAFYRYALFIKIAAVPYILWKDEGRDYKRLSLIVFFMLYLIGFLVDILVLRDNIVASYFSGFWTTYHIFTSERLDVINGY